MLENDFVKKVQGRMFTTFHFNVVVSVNCSPLSFGEFKVTAMSRLFS